jgi:hypothetical protein
MPKSTKRARQPKPPFTPLKPDQTTTPNLSAKHYEMIGKVVVVWSKLEAAMDDTIWHFLKLDMEDGRIVTTRLDARTKATMIRSLSEWHLSKDDQDGLATVLTVISERQDDRNFIAHGTWGTLLPDNVPIAMSLRPKSPNPDEVTAETFPERRMHEIVNDVAWAIDQLVRLMTALRASQDKQNGPNLAP